MATASIKSAPIRQAKLKFNKLAVLIVAAIVIGGGYYWYRLSHAATFEAGFAKIVIHIGYGPKGIPPLISGVVPPQPNGSCTNNTCFFYASQTQTVSATSVEVKIKQSDPNVDSQDYHSIGELAVESADQKQIVEIGWTVDKSLNGDTKPHLFVYHWEDGHQTCYNGCGYRQISSKIAPSDPVAVGKTGTYRITHVKNQAWFLYYNGVKLGFFPDSLWSDNFTKFDAYQAFGEVGAASTSPCTDMGNGRFGSAKNAATFSGIVLGGTKARVRYTLSATNPNLFNTGKVHRGVFGWGGPGAC